MPFPIIGAIAAVAGIGLSLFGQSENAKAQEKAAVASAAAARQQRQFAEQQNKIIDKTIKPLLVKQGEAQASASAESRKAEELRRAQMRLDVDRTQRDIARNMAFGRSLALSRSVAQGGGGALSSSGLLGSLAQITAQGGRQRTGVNQNAQIGEGIFSANIASSEFMSKANKFGTEVNLAQMDLQTIQNKAGGAAATSQARVNALANQRPGDLYATLGQGIISNIGQIDRLGTSALFGSNQSWYNGPSNGYFYNFAADDPYSPV